MKYRIKKILVLIILCLIFIPMTRVKAANFYKLTLDSANGEEKQDLYMLYDLNDLKLFNKLDYDIEKYANITKIGVEIPTRKGYAFGGYYIKNGSIQFVDANANIRKDNIEEYIDGPSGDIKNIYLEAKWEKLSYRVDLIANGEVFRKIYFSNLEDSNVYSSDSLKITSIDIPLCNNSKYEFAGYYVGKTKVIDENGNIILVDRSDSNGKQALIKKAMGSNKSIYIKAKWKLKKVNTSQTSEYNSNDVDENVETNGNINTNNVSNKYENDFIMQYEDGIGKIEEIETEQVSQTDASTYSYENMLKNPDSDLMTTETKPISQIYRGTYGSVNMLKNTVNNLMTTKTKHIDASTYGYKNVNMIGINLTTGETNEFQENSVPEESAGLEEDSNTNPTTSETDGYGEELDNTFTDDQIDSQIEGNSDSAPKTDETYEKGGTTDIETNEAAGATDTNTKKAAAPKEKYAICYLKDNNVAVGESKNFNYEIKGYKGYKYSIKLSDNNQKIIKLNGRRFTGLKVGRTKVKLIGTKNNKHYLMKECTIMVHNTPMKKSEQKIIESDESKNDILRNTVKISDELRIEKPKKIKKITCKTNEIKVGKTKKIIFGVSPADANKNVKLKVANAASNKKISINGTKITGKKAGTAKVVITSKSNKKVKKTCKIKIVKKVSKTKIKKKINNGKASSSLTTKKSNSASSSAVSTPSQTNPATSSAVSTPSQTNPATSSAVSTPSQTKEKIKKAKKKVTSVKLTASKKTIKVGKTLKIKAEIVNKTGVKSKKWISSNEKVATVSSSGKVTALSVGKTTIKLIVTDKTGKVKSSQINIKVKGKPKSKKKQVLTETKSNEIIGTNFQSAELVQDKTTELKISKTGKVSNPAACKVQNNNTQVGVISFKRNENGGIIFGQSPGNGYLKITCGNYYKIVPYSVKKFVLIGDTNLKKGQCSSLAIVGNAKKCDWKIFNGGSHVYLRKAYGAVNYSELKDRKGVKLCGVDLTTVNPPKLTITCDGEEISKDVTVTK